MDAAEIPGADGPGADVPGADMPVTERLLERLRRIRELEGCSPDLLLGELRGLVADAEEWARLEGDERARIAVERLGDALTGVEEVMPPALSLR
jgi:hypothetical protein